MVVIDTNILSELVRPSPAQEVKKWLQERTGDEVMVTTAITISEIKYGLARMADGRKRKQLTDRFEALTGEHFDFAVLPFDDKAARIAGRMRATREGKGLHAHSADMMIAAIAHNAGATLATRNTKDFTDVGLEIINPWELMN